MSEEPTRKMSTTHGLVIAVSAIGLVLVGLSGLDGINKNLHDWEGALWVLGTAITFFLLTRVLLPR